MVNYVKSNALKAQMARKKQDNHYEKEIEEDEEVVAAIVTKQNV